METARAVVTARAGSSDRTTMALVFSIMSADRYVLHKLANYPEREALGRSEPASRSMWLSRIQSCAPDRLQAQCSRGALKSLLNFRRVS